MKSSTKLSTIITTYDQHAVTLVHVLACMNSSRPPDEIIVVDDHGHPGMRDLLVSMKKTVPVTYARIKEDIPWNYTGARNLGVWLSTGDMLSIEDTDNIPSEHAYRDSLEFFDKNPDAGHLLYGKRAKITKKTALNVPIKEWKTLGSRPRHSDTCMLRRDTYLDLKGCDERFAGKYAWACTNWRRRLQMAGHIVEGLKMGQMRPAPNCISTHFWTVIDGETSEEGLVIRRKSYENYNLASDRSSVSKYLKLFRKIGDEGELKEVESEKGHIQAPLGIINFTYTYERL